MTKSKMIMLMAAALMITAISATDSFAQYGKFGYVDSDRIATEYKAVLKAQEELETESKAWDDKAREMQVQLEEMLEEYEKQRLILSDDKKKEREAAINTQKQALDAFTKEIYGPQGTAERKYAALMKPIYDNINQAISQISTEGNYDFIFNSAALAFAKPEFDITDKVLEMLEEE